jgi:hypothetical protein
MTAKVKYSIATYEGTILVSCTLDEDDESIIARAKRILRHQAGSFPIGIYYESWRVIYRTDNGNQ